MASDQHQDQRKREAARRALELVKPGMKLGLGSGTTAHQFVDLVGEAVKGGLEIVCVGTSKATEAQASSLGIPLSTLDEIAELDLTVDGADEIGPELALIKGGGAALLREKIVAVSSRRMIVIADESKLVARLGRYPLPVEVIEFGHKSTAARIAAAASALGYRGLVPRLRVRDGAVVRSDSGNLIYDCPFGAITSAATLAGALADVAGVVDHGLFVGIAHTLLIAHPGEVEIIERGK